jgi:hypothetical protein
MPVLLYLVRECGIVEAAANGRAAAAAVAANTGLAHPLLVDFEQ